ncbi:helix-turn-helix transcriptional regulator [Amorphoplanes digitatis]|uniref:Putative DNA-binding transcriptional regulator YafY n=1 Tax=Actinoplanes digitatis TaxID=1868 RepID=A0A7W7MRN7_9ACTN|nr:WYL domain-containing protein [Actinoplanes digitatis]MBB4764466.1 putative DNA-binding transcriptional regulator YafY [Actinoplanes digitatis]GID94047.1 transcriptional regulator [Actinoplanes digitatis]
MKADRLVATLLYLQARGRTTVGELAAELEVSHRTARRDLEALAAAGVPVYSRRGRGGGWSLVGGARTELTGLTAGEIRALFLVAGPPAAETPELRLALRKLVRALPSTLRSGAEAAARAVVVDGTDWSRSAAPAGPHLDPLRRAVLDGERVRLGYAGRDRPAGVRLVDPLGLVSKAGAWYLVAGTPRGLRAFRLSRVRSVEATSDPVRRPDGFDLAAAWRSLAARVEDRMLAATAGVRARRDALPVLRGVLGERLRVVRELADGWVEIEVAGPSADVLAAQLAGFGARVEVLWPAETRNRLSRLAGELAALYWTGPEPPYRGADRRELVG